MTTCFRPTPYRDLHIGGLFNAYVNWTLARLSGGEFVLVVDDLCMDLAATWQQGESVEFMVPRYLEDLEWFGMVPDRIEYSLRNRDFQREVAERLVQREVGPVGDRQPWVPYVTKTWFPCNFGDRPMLPVGVEGWVGENLVEFQPYYLACCIADDIAFGITAWIAGDDQRMNLVWCLDAYERLGHPAPYIMFHPLVKRQRATHKLSKSAGDRDTVRAMREAGYTPEQVVDTLLECSALAWEKGLQCIVIPDGVLGQSEVRALEHRNRYWEQLTTADFYSDLDALNVPPDELYRIKQHIAEAAKARLREREERELKGDLP